MPRLLLLAAALAFGPPPIWGADAPAKPASTDGKPADVFVTTKVMKMHLTIPAKAFAAMQPTRGAFPGPGGPGPGRQPPPKGDDGRKPRGGMGLDFAWVTGDLEIDEAVLKDVAVRYKGSGTYITSAQGAKRPFKIDLGKHDEGQAFKGVKRLTLNNNVMDPSAARDAMAYAVYRAAGVPAPRTAYVELSLTVPGKYDKEFLGLYTLVETIDKPFLQDRFGSAKGLLVKPERVGAMEYLGEEWKPYEEKYRPKTTASKKARKRLIEFARLVQKDNAAAFVEKIDSFLDVDEFLRFLASTVLLSNLDSFIGLNHNWMLYLDPKTDKFVFLPWDLDLSFGAFFPMGTPQQLMDLSIEKPYVGTNKLISRLFENEKHYAAYKGHLKRLMASGFTADAAKKDLAAIRAVVAPIQEREKKAVAARKENRGGFGPGGMFNNALPVDAFVKGRVASVTAQLAGKSKGTQARGFGAPGGGPGGPGGGQGFRGFDPAALVRPAMQAADKDKDGKLTKEEAVDAVEALFAACGADAKGEVDQASLAKALEKAMPRPQAFGPFTPPSQAPVMARRIIEKAGRNGKLTRAGLVAATNKVFARADKNKDGKLDDGELGEALRVVLPSISFGGPGRFNPALMFARPALEAADKDIDGKLTKAEVVSAVKAVFARCAADDKGEVDQASLAKALDKLLPKPPGFGGFTPPSQAPAMAKRIVERAGKGGKVTEARLVAEAERRFAEADKDGDGKLDEAEFAEALRDLVPPPQFGPPPVPPKKEAR